MPLAAHCISRHQPESLSLLLANGCPTTNLLWHSVNFQDRLCFDVLLSHGCDVNEPHPRGGTSLHHCIPDNLVYFATRLLSLGVDLSVTDSEGLLPIQKAILNGRREIALLILGHGSPMRALGSAHSALLSAIEYGDLRLIAVVLGAGADPNNVAGQAPLNLAIEKSSEPAVRLLLAVGAIRAAQIPLNFKPLFDKWKVVEPKIANAKSEAAILQTKLRADQTEAAAFIAKAADPSQFQGPLTPLLGETNKMVVLLAELAKNVEREARKLRESRQREIANQLKWLAEREKTSIVQAAFLADEENWRSNISEALEKLSEFEDSLFPGNICNAIREYLASLETKPKRNDAKDVEWDRPSEEERERRAQLLFLNRKLNDYRIVVEKVYTFSVQLLGCIKQMLDGIEGCLKEIIDVLVTQQQLNFDFEKVHMEASISAQAAGVLQDRKELLTLDLALVEWEKVQFMDISVKIQRLLRYCMI